MYYLDYYFRGRYYHYSYDVTYEEAMALGSNLPY